MPYIQYTSQVHTAGFEILLSCYPDSNPAPVSRRSLTAKFKAVQFAIFASLTKLQRWKYLIINVIHREISKNRWRCIQIVLSAKFIMLKFKSSSQLYFIFIGSCSKRKIAAVRVADKHAVCVLMIKIKPLQSFFDYSNSSGNNTIIIKGKKKYQSGSVSY